MIGFIGLSHLGLNYSLATAAKGFNVICYDPDIELVARLRNGVFPIDEPRFNDLFLANRDRINYTSESAEIGKCELVFYSLDVGTDERNKSDMGPLSALIERTVSSLSPKTTAVVMSQIRPGYMRTLLERYEAQVAFWYYQVETLIFGAAVERAMEPERYIVGSSNPETPVPTPYRVWMDAFRCPVLLMRFESAELAKIAINLFLVSSVSTTNTLAEICEVIGADWSEIAPALRLDKRIGPQAYLSPGLGIAGGNLERDLVTVQNLATDFGTEAGIVDAWQRNSAHAKSWALRILERELLKVNPRARISIWGLAYKQDTHSIKNSASIELLRTLSGCDLQAYDPVAKVTIAFFTNLSVHTSALDAVPFADALAIMTPWKEFSAIAPSEIAKSMMGNLVVDPYGVLDHRACVAAGLRHFQLGRP